MASPPAPTLTDELRAAVRLGVHATTQVTEVVQEMHVTIGGGPALLGRPLAGVLRVLTAPTYGSILGITRLVGTGLDTALARLGPALGPATSGAERDLLVGALNGVVGDHLEETGSALAVPMQLRRQGRPLHLEPQALARDLDPVTGRLLLLVHGSSATDQSWTRNGHHHGEAVAGELGLTWVALNYNTGLHVSTNGQRLDALLEQAISAWPVPVTEISVIAHSMGGLVTRAACNEAEAAGHRWRRLLRAIVFLGTPHHGAPLERGGNWLHAALGGVPYSAPLARLARLRSAGVTDLRHGNVRDADWQGEDRFARHDDRRAPLPLPTGVDCFAVAACLEGLPAAVLPGDGMVPVDSALGHHPRLDLGFPPERTWLLRGKGHLDLLDHPEVTTRLRGWLGGLG